MQQPINHRTFPKKGYIVEDDDPTQRYIPNQRKRRFSFVKSTGVGLYEFMFKDTKQKRMQTGQTVRLKGMVFTVFFFHKFQFGVISAKDTIKINSTINFGSTNCGTCALRAPKAVHDEYLYKLTEKDNERENVVDATADAEEYVRSKKQLVMALQENDELESEKFDSLFANAIQHLNVETTQINTIIQGAEEEAESDAESEAEESGESDGEEEEDEEYSGGSGSERRRNKRRRPNQPMDDLFDTMKDRIHELEIKARKMNKETPPLIRLRRSERIYNRTIKNAILKEFGTWEVYERWANNMTSFKKL